MKALRAFLGVLLSASLLGAGQMICPRAAAAEPSCCAHGAAGHSKRHQGTGSSCAARCASPAITTHALAAPESPDRWALAPALPALPSGRPTPVVRLIASAGRYESPPGRRLRDRSPPRAL